MTALKEYARLESSGLWRPEPDGQRRAVGVSFGDATLVISDQAGRPLTHWSLPAVARLNPGTRPALYSPDAEATETLEIEDDLMIGAIEKVRRSLARARPRRGRLRQAGFAAAGLAGLALAVFWLPGALIGQTLTMVPPAKRSEIGATLLGHIQRVTGPTCRDPLGAQALSRLGQRVLGDAAGGQIVVLPEGPATPIYLPGGIIVLPRALIEGAEDPAVVAGAILAAVIGRGEVDPLSPILREAGLRTTLKLLTTGNIPTEVLQAHARHLLETQPPTPDIAALIPAFEVARLPIGPWAASAALEVPASPEAEPLPPALSDGDWISLQGICRS